MKFSITHPRHGTLLLVPCSGHAHSACWIFEANLPAFERFDKSPVTFGSKKKAAKYIEWLVDIYPQFAGAVIETAH